MIQVVGQTRFLQREIHVIQCAQGVVTALIYSGSHPEVLRLA